MPGSMDATTAPHRIPPEMPQYGEANHIFEMMQVTRAAPPCRHTGRRPGNLCRGIGVRAGDLAAGGHICYPRDGLAWGV